MEEEVASALVQLQSSAPSNNFTAKESSPNPSSPNSPKSKKICAVQTPEAMKISNIFKTSTLTCSKELFSPDLRIDDKNERSECSMCLVHALFMDVSCSHCVLLAYVFGS